LPAQPDAIRARLSQAQGGAPAAPAKPAAAKPAPAQPKLVSAPVKPTATQVKPAPAQVSAPKPAANSKPASSSAQANPAAKAPARRDPFESLVSAEKGPAVPQNLPAGKAGLMVNTLNLDGIVRGPNGMIAIVSNPQERVYFLREGDQLYDGQVGSITMEAVSFHESGKDPFGAVIERDITRRLYTSPGEQP
jgi:hypothetical protein